MNDIVRRFNNTLLHHGAQALSFAGRYDEDERAVTFDVGPSTRHIRGALLGAYFTYANVASLVDTSEELVQVYNDGIGAFLTVGTG